MNAPAIVRRGFALLLLLATQLFLWGQDPSSWDDIHFETGSSVLVDGFSSLARVANLLAGHRDYRVQLTGYTDSLEDKTGGQKLSLARAQAVKSYLLGLGASAEQIEVRAAGASSPLAGNETKEGRFRNRRVAISIVGGQGRIVKEGGVDDALTGLQADSRRQADADDQLFKRLDKLDDILAAQKSQQAENDRIKAELSDLRNQNNMLRDQINGWPKPPTQSQVQDAVRSAIESPHASSSSGPWWTGGLSGRAFLIGKATEEKKYGLYSYFLIPRKPAPNESDLKNKYIATLDAYQAMIDTVAELRNQSNPPALSKINITYLPLQFMPDKIASDKILEANNSALAQILLQMLKAKHPGVETRDGPFIVSYIKPLIGLDRIDEHLFIDMSRAPSDAANLYVRAFLTQAGRESYWEKDRNQWVLDCYSFIENAGGQFASVSQQYKDKSFLATVFGWFK